MKLAHHDVKFIGLIYFCMDSMKAIKTLIDTLRIPSLETRVRVTAPRVLYGNRVALSGNHLGYVFRSAEHQTT